MEAHILLFDTPDTRAKLLPLTYTRPISALRVGITVLSEKWKDRTSQSVSACTERYLSEKFPAEFGSNNLYVSGGISPNDALLKELQALDFEMRLVKDNQLVAFRTSQKPSFDDLESFASTLESKECQSDFNQVLYPWDIFRLNGEEIRNDFELIKKERTSQSITDNHTIVYNAENVFLEEGATVKAAVLNAENGPIYIGKNAEIQEGAMIRGPFAICESGVVNMGAKIRGDSTVGPHSKVGGEISNSVILGYSNKGHDGFIGNSVIGEWCNLGADTNTSNLKNNYAEVRVWNYKSQSFAKTGLQFCGLIMGDHSKCGINTMFNTGTVIGVNSNIFGSGFPRNFVPSYAWGGSSGFTTYQTRKAFEVANVVMQRRKLELTQVEQDILTHVFEASADFRIWEKENK